MDNIELKKISNWYFPQLKELGSSRNITHHKEHILAKYHHLVDMFFSYNQLREHYEAILNANTVKNRKAFKSRFLAIYLQLMKLYLDNPQHYGHLPSGATARALTYWQLHCIIKYRGLVKYTNKVNHLNLDLPSGNYSRWSIPKKKIPILVDRFHNPLFDLAEKIII